MKVCTDACILGAWAGEKLKTELPAPSILDIGTGTGLLSLMIAQKTAALIDAIEVDGITYEQASENFKRSPWSEHLQPLHADAKHYSPKKKYGFIISNPPFYEDDLLSAAAGKNVAKHDKALKLDELILVIKRNLHSAGNFAVLLPYHRINYFEDIAYQNHFFCQEKLLIKQTYKHDYFRGILWFSQTRIKQTTNELIIKNNENYSEEFILLMKDYYLNL